MAFVYKFGVNFQVTNTVVSKQLKIWNMMHTVVNDDPLPVLSTLVNLAKDLSNENNGQGSAMDLKPSDFSVLFVDFSQVNGKEETDKLLKSVEELNYGTIIVVKRSQKNLEELKADCALMSRKPVVLNKPMVSFTLLFVLS